MRALLFSLALLGACAAQPESPAMPDEPASAPEAAAPQAGADNALEGTEWTLVANDEIAPRTITIGPDGRAAGRGGCNRWFATLNTANGWSFGPIGATKMACLGPEMEAERVYFAMLERVRAGAVENGQLVLRDASGAEIARFAPAR